jgi:hypothetical protein
MDIFANTSVFTILYVPEDVHQLYGRMVVSGTTSHSLFDHVLPPVADEQASLMDQIDKHMTLMKQNEQELRKHLVKDEEERGMFKLVKRDATRWSSLHCPQKHSLISFSRDTRWIWDTCLKSQAYGNSLWCHDCDFDICERCSKSFT